MIEYQYVQLPEEFTQLFKVNMESVGKHFKSLPIKAKVNKSFYYLAKYSFKEYGVDFDLTVILKKMGWHGLRDRLTAQYIGFLKNGNYSENVDLRRVQALQDIELQYASFRVQGYSRAYLLGLYFKVWSLQGQNPGYAEEMLDILRGNRISHLLKEYPARVVGIDWLLLILLNLYRIYGEKEIGQKVKDSDGLNSLLKSLDSETRGRVLKSLAYYALSIGDESMMLKNLPQ